MSSRKVRSYRSKNCIFPDFPSRDISVMRFFDRSLKRRQPHQQQTSKQEIHQEIKQPRSKRIEIT